MSWINPRGYVVVQQGDDEVYEHRLVWQAAHGAIPNAQHIDHINGVKHDNRLENLRLASSAENQQNRRAAQKNNKSSGLLGAYFHKASGKWASRIRAYGVDHNLGYHATAQAAHAVYLEAKRRLHPFGTL